jgi:hypothetical protein
MARGETQGEKGLSRLRLVRHGLAWMDLRSWMEYDRFVKRLPFLVFCTVLAMLYIGNRYSCERKVRELAVLQKKVEEHRFYYDSTKDELARNSRQSRVAERVAGRGVVELTDPPIILSSGQQEKRTNWLRQLSTRSHAQPNERKQRNPQANR